MGALKVQVSSSFPLTERAAYTGKLIASLFELVEKAEKRFHADDVVISSDNSRVNTSRTSQRSLRAISHRAMSIGETAEFELRNFELDVIAAKFNRNARGAVAPSVRA
jgi:hypothetical protein